MSWRGSKTLIGYSTRRLFKIIAASRYTLLILPFETQLIIDRDRDRNLSNPPIVDYSVPAAVEGSSDFFTISIESIDT